MGGQEGDQGVQLRGSERERRRREEKEGQGRTGVGWGGGGGGGGGGGAQGEESRARREGKEGSERVFLACHHCCHEVVKVSNSCSPFHPAQSTGWQAWHPENCA